MDKLYASFRDAYNEFQQMTKKYDGLEAEIGNVREDIGQKKTACEAFDKIVIMYKSQIESVDKVLNEILLKKNQTISSTRLLAASLMPMLANRAPSPSNRSGSGGSATAAAASSSSSNTNSAASSSNANVGSPTDSASDDVEQTQRLMNLNREKLKMRVDDLEKKRDEVRAEIDYLNKVLGQLQEELDMLRPELIELRKKRENYHMWLLQRGENDDRIQARLKGALNNARTTTSSTINKYQTIHHYHHHHEKRNSSRNRRRLESIG